VGEVDQLEDPVDERVAEGDECIKGAAREARERELDERRPVLEGVDDEPADDDRDEREADAVDDPGLGGCPRTTDYVRLGAQSRLL
jgi:hypothetical protein